MPRAKRIFIALGSNLGERLGNLQKAAAGMPPEVDVLAASLIYETDPWGFVDQPAYLNQVLEATTRLEPAALLAYLKQLESRLGRVVTFRNGPRIIDLDILFYDRLIMKTDGLCIPHPRMHERAFVLVPLADLAPGFRHPVLKKTVQELLQEVDQHGVHQMVEG
jgi:2-amino-4-hydroxy-6-hydroxymethyldihydropteridine diphosphokinase